MKLLRNPEVRRDLIFHLLLTAALTAAGFLSGTAAGWMLLAAGVLFTLYDLLAAVFRLRRIEKLCGEIDRVLHGCDTIDFSGQTEGELSLLRSELAKMTVRLREQSDRLVRDKTYLADSMADISHQLRTPLTSMNLIVSFLGERGLPERRRIELARELAMLLARMQWQVNALLKISRLDTGTVTFRREETPVRELVSKALEPLTAIMELRGQTARVEIGEEQFLGDVEWSAEALGNIIKNCSEHTPEGGSITISVQENAVFTELTVTDTGSGIAPEDLPHIFERFYRGRNAAANSAGIGLALARMILSGQGGTLRAENRREGGVRFIIRFYRCVV